MRKTRFFSSNVWSDVTSAVTSAKRLIGQSEEGIGGGVQYHGQKTHFQWSWAMQEEKMAKNLTKSIPNFTNKTMESLLELSKSGNKVRIDNTIRAMSNTKHATKHETKYR